jgi:hypothetical protein
MVPYRRLPLAYRRAISGLALLFPFHREFYLSFCHVRAQRCRHSVETLIPVFPEIQHLYPIPDQLRGWYRDWGHLAGESLVKT